jgi:DNA-binding winged helix-turn-helix (wHTH) protein
MRLQFGDFVFDTRLHVLMRGRTVVEVSPKAFALLEMLVEARPAPVSKEQAYDRLWPATFVEPGNLHNLISEIRAAIGDDDHAIIKTVRGVGYAFDAQARTLEASRFAVVVGRELVRLQSGENIIGRDPAAAVVIDSPDVSRNHARLTVWGDEVTLEDLGSKNGTFVGSERIAGPRQVRAGDDIVIGRSPIILRELVAGSTVTF